MMTACCDPSGKISINLVTCDGPIEVLPYEEDIMLFFVVFVWAT